MRLTQALGGLGLLVLGGAVAWILKPPSPYRPLQVTGDPPITVSDGSLHAHSANNWTTNADNDTTIQPNPPMGRLLTSCGMLDSQKNLTPLSLWADDTIYDIMPGTTITIVHDSDDASSNPHAAEVTISLPGTATPGPLTIHTNEGTFLKDKGDKGGKHNRHHSREGEVESITYTNPQGMMKTWVPQNTHNPHFSLLFCFKP